MSAKSNNRRQFCTFEGLENRTLMSAVSAVELPSDLINKINPRVWAVAQDSLLGLSNPLIASRAARFDGHGNLQTYLFATGTTRSLATTLSGMGIKVDGRSDAMHAVEAWLPAGMVDDVARLNGVPDITL